MDVEEVLERINGWGRYQKAVYLLACLTPIFAATVTVGYSWTGYISDHRCLVEECEDPSNATYDSPFLRWSTPADADHTWSRCQRYRPTSVGGCTNTSFFTNQTESCSRWVYDKSVMESTVVSEFDLVCDSAKLQPLVSSLFFVGTALGSVISGFVADRYGRMIALMCSIVGTGLFGGLGALASSYGTFTAMRFLSSICQYGLFGVAFVWCTEFTSIEVRAFCGIIINIFFAIGEALSGVFPIFVKDWTSLQLIYSVPVLIFVSYWFLVPESPRWLMATNQPKKAEQVLRKIAKWNGTTFPEELLKKNNVESTEESPSTTESFLDAMKSPVLRLRAIILCLQWFVVTLVYYGIGMVSTEFGGDVYVNFILTMLIEIPSYLFCAFTINPLGRKLVIGGAFALTGLGTILCAVVPDDADLEWLTTTLALLGKFGAASAFSTMYLYTAELYPDALRAKGVGFASTSGRLGAIIAPFIADLGQGDTTLPLCIFGVTGLVSAGLTMLLPETSGQDLPVTIAEAIEFGKGQSLLPIPCLVARRQRKREHIRGFDGPQIQLPDTEGDASDQGHSKTV
ncbi:organic cation transporter protein-like [Amphibalanus amphitrite]|uniref:organic cation transporter protein-like n=1 Tax=Amphibalanus amphitrite TaxID=1232801 RepID=UPI001C904D2D|nr:organic cation transporter protein-like [Amphibalanus amphitrite]